MSRSLSMGLLVGFAAVLGLIVGLAIVAGSWLPLIGAPLLIAAAILVLVSTPTLKACRPS